MISIATLPVLTHNEMTSQFVDMGIPLGKDELQPIRVDTNIMKVSVAVPRGDSAVRLLLPGQPLRSEIRIDDFHAICKHLGIPFIKIPVPFGESMAKQLVDTDDMAEFFPVDNEIPSESEGGIRNIMLLVNVLNIAHYGSVTPERTNIMVIGQPNTIPVSLSIEEVRRLIREAVSDVSILASVRNGDFMYNNFYDACPDGWTPVIR